MEQLTSSGPSRIGIGIFDHEHREIVAAIIEVQAAVEAGRDRSVTGPLLLKLAHRTEAHFQSEEAMMASSKYPGAKLHAMKHQRLLEQLSAFLARYSRDNSTLDRYSLNFLRDWCNTHIQSDDLNFGRWLNEHGKR